MLNEKFRKAVTQSTIKAMAGSYEEREKLKGVFQDVLNKAQTEGQIDNDGAAYLKSIILVLTDPNDLEEADAKIPDKYAEDWKTILKNVNHLLTANEQGLSISLEGRQHVIRNTIAVLTSAPEMKTKWLGALRDLKVQAIEEYKMPELAQYLEAVMQLIEGKTPDKLSENIPEILLADWETIISKINS